MKHRSVDLRMTNVMQEQEDRKSRSPSRISSDQLSGTEMNGGEPVASYGQWGYRGRGVVNESCRGGVWQWGVGRGVVSEV